MIITRLKISDQCWWNLFKQTEQFYINQNYRYRGSIETDGILYSEFADGKQIVSYYLTDFEIAVLRAAEKKVLAIPDLSKVFPKMTNKELESTLNALKAKGLIYLSEEFKELVSLIIILQDIINKLPYPVN